MNTGSMNPLGSTDANNALLGFNTEAEFQNAPIDNWRNCFPEFIGRGAAVQKLLQIIYKVARSDSSVLIYGESGTGKELIASALHRLSPRSTKRFIPINCSAIPESLLESELFGHEKGAFTGATSKRVGHFEMASGGTIFLDEIGDMPYSLQSKLLRVLQDQHFTSIGSSELKKANVRIVAATNIDLQKAVQQNKFRLDLFYRLNVLPIHVPSLKERKEDVADLIYHFLEITNRKHNIINPCYFSPTALETLMNYPWPGNVRELQNLVERLVILSGGGGVIDREHLPEEYLQQTQLPTISQQNSYHREMDLPTPMKDKAEPNSEPLLNSILQDKENVLLPDKGVNLTALVEDLENRIILQALNKTRNNKNQAAKLLGLNRTTLVERIKKRKLAPLNSPSKEL